MKSEKEYNEFIDDFMGFIKFAFWLILTIIIVGWSYDRYQATRVLNKNYVPIVQAQQAINQQAQQYEAKIKKLEAQK